MRFTYLFGLLKFQYGFSTADRVKNALPFISFKKFQILTLNWPDRGIRATCPGFGRFAHELRSFENSYIPENPRTPKPLTFSKNRLWGAKNRSNTSPVAKKNSRKKQLFFFKNFAYVQKQIVHMCMVPKSFFERNNGFGDIGNWGSSRVLGNIWFYLAPRLSRITKVWNDHRRNPTPGRHRGGPGYIQGDTGDHHDDSRVARDHDRRASDDCDWCHATLSSRVILQGVFCVLSSAVQGEHRPDYLHALDLRRGGCISD
ncbi:hypothetical protein LXL04_020554 [Taraxacum kok-saghyz]